MAETRPVTTQTGPTTADGFLADRMAFWGRFTGFTTKTAAALIFFCAWLWWATFAGFGLLHIVLLPIGVAVIWAIL